MLHSAARGVVVAISKGVPRNGGFLRNNSTFWAQGPDKYTYGTMILLYIMRSTVYTVCLIDVGILIYFLFQEHFVVELTCVIGDDDIHISEALIEAGIAVRLVCFLTYNTVHTPMGLFAEKRRRRRKRCYRKFK